MSTCLYIPTNKSTIKGEMSTMAKLAKIRNISLEETQRLQSVPGVYTDVFTRELDVINEELKLEDGVPKVYLNLHVGSNQTFALSLEQLEIREDPSRVQYQLIPQPPAGMVQGEQAQATLVPAMPTAPPSISLEELQRQKEQEKIAQVQRTLEIQAAARQAEEEAKAAQEAEAQARRQAIIDSARAQIGIGASAGVAVPSSVSIPMASTQQAGSFQYQQDESGAISLDGLTPITGAMAFMMLSSGYEVIDSEGGALEFHKRSGQVRRYVGQSEDTIDNISAHVLMSPSYYVHESFLKAFIDSFAKIGQASF